MNKIPYPQKVDLKKYSKDNNPKSYYGLPEEVKFCKKCVMSNQKTNSTIEFKNNIEEKKKTINFDDNGFCDGCNFSKKKRKLIGLIVITNLKNFVINIGKKKDLTIA